MTVFNCLAALLPPLVLPVVTEAPPVLSLVAPLVKAQEIELIVFAPAVVVCCPPMIFDSPETTSGWQLYITPGLICPTPSSSPSTSTSTSTSTSP